MGGDGAGPGDGHIAGGVINIDVVGVFSVGGDIAVGKDGHVIIAAAVTCVLNENAMGIGTIGFDTSGFRQRGKHEAVGVVNIDAVRVIVPRANAPGFGYRHITGGRFDAYGTGVAAR